MLTRLLLLLAIVHPVNAEAPGFRLWDGLVFASEQEAAECYFNVSYSEAVPGALLAFPPKSAACDVARLELRGKRGRLVFVVE